MQKVQPIQLKEFRVTGPPGTGKTTWIIRQVERAIASGISPDKIVCCSLTRAAARELAGRDSAIPARNIGTLHALAYRALSVQRDQLVDRTPKLAHLWNQGKEWANNRDPWKFATDADQENDVTAVASHGRLMAEYQLNRSRMWPLTGEKITLDRAWRAFLAEHGAIDFTGILEVALETLDTAAGEPAVFVVDEAQDFAPLPLALARKWGEAATYRFLMVGDPDQAIYEFAGATPDALQSTGVPENQRIVLSKSWRVPRAVHKLAVEWIGGLDEREDAAYEPTEVEGDVVRMPQSMRESPSVTLRIARKHIENGQTVMALAPANYQISPVVSLCMREGFPYSNRWRRKARHWNPLAPAARGVSTADRLHAFLLPTWTVAQLAKWLKPLRAKGLVKYGMRGGIEKLAKDHGSDEVDEPALRHWFEPDALIEMPPASDPVARVRWYARHISASYSKPMGYFTRVVANHGVEALTVEPKLTVGTIHSVKGGEADVVIMSCELATSASNEWYRTRREGAIRRLWYVGMTRARHTLYLMGSPRYGGPRP